MLISARTIASTLLCFQDGSVSDDELEAMLNEIKVIQAAGS